MISELRALALLAGTLPLPVAWGARLPSTRWFPRHYPEHPSLPQAEEAQGDGQGLQRVCGL